MKRKVNGQSPSLVKSVLIGCITSILVMILTLCIMSYLEIEGYISESTGEKIVIGIQFLSTVLGCIVASRKFGSSFLMSSLIAGLGYFLVLIIISLTFFDGSFTSVLQGFIIIVSGAIVSLGYNWSKKRSVGTRKRRLYSR